MILNGPWRYGLDRLRAFRSLTPPWRPAGIGGELCQRVVVVNGVAAGDLVQPVALDQPFDGDFELLAGAGMRQGGDGDDVVGNVPG